MQVPKELSLSFQKVQEAFDKIQKLEAAHPEIIQAYRSLREELESALSAYASQAREWLKRSGQTVYVDPLGNTVRDRGVDRSVDTSALAAFLGPELASRYLDEKVVYELKDDTTLDRLVAEGVISAIDLEEFVEEKRRTPSFIKSPQIKKL